MLRALDSDNDWTIGGAFLTGRQEVMQDCETRLREWRNDCFWNRSAGVDYSAFLQNSNNKALALQQINICNRTDGVIQVEDYEQGLDIEQRILSPKITISTLHGEGVIHA